MLEGLVAWVLNNYLGKYVEDLNTDQLSIALLSGEVELENLPLRKDALRHLGVPIQVRAGFIGKVKLQIPVRQIRSAPWVIVIEQLYLVAGPVKLSEWNHDAEEIVAQEIKQSALDAREAKWRAESETTPQTGYYASSYSTWISYGTGFMTNIVENLQLKIKDVHIRYEDEETIPNHAFACGITIESLSAQSCDQNWSPGFTQWDSSDHSFKLLELTSLGVYWDTLQPPSELFGSLSMAQLANVMGNTISSNSHQSIMQPVSAVAHIKRNRSVYPLRLRSTPRIVCDLTLETVSFKLANWQYDQMIQCIRGLDEIARLRKYRLHRPNVTIKENPRSWWIYAIRCMLGVENCPKLCSPTPTWESCLTRAKENVKYVEICAKMFASPTAALGIECKTLKDHVEWTRELNELNVLREIAMSRVPIAPTTSPTATPSAQGRSMLVQWFPQWWGWYSSEESSDMTQMISGNTKEPTIKTTAELEHEILDALADTFENNTILRRDTVFGQFNFTLRQGNFLLCTANETKTERTSMIELQYENVKLSVEIRPRTSSHKFEIVLGALYLHDRLTLDSQFPVLISPQGKEHGTSMARVSSRILSPRLDKSLNSNQTSHGNSEPLFQLIYEQKPFNSNVDYKLLVHSQALDIVYNPTATQWLATFLAGPHQQRINLPTRSRIGADLFRNWEQILEGDLNARKSWELYLDISAPQIILVEQFTDRNAAVAVVDFGRLQLTNCDKSQVNIQQPSTATNNKIVPVPISNPSLEHRDSEDEDNFQTPCSTPPGSEASDSSSEQITIRPTATTDQDIQRQTSLPNTSVTEISLHQKLYDRYNIELTDLQILVGKVRDNWKYAHTKGTSTLHVLDRFNITLNVERRVVFTNDPLYPNLTVNANLPKLVVHVNEQKVSTIRKLYNILTTNGLPSPFRSPQQGMFNPVETMTKSMTSTVDTSEMEAPVSSHIPVDESSEENSKYVTRLIMLQFSVDHMALEVQSRGRSVAELQVAGVKIAFTQRDYDMSISLSVHGLLLVDALQTFGPDFELLVASHKHVGMDSVSGSLRDSEPCSPTSPGSPDPTIAKVKTTSPIALTHALSSLTMDSHNASVGARAVSPTRSFPTSPPSGSIGIGRNTGSLIGLEQLDADALITVEVWIVNGPDRLQHANIQFNNLDIIANQETIVELMGFTRRVFPRSSTTLKPTKRILSDSFDYSSGTKIPPNTPNEEISPPIIPSPPLIPPPLIPENTTSASSSNKTEITFDFHRLNVLLFRAVVKDGSLQGRKIATATMSEARIQATVDTALTVEGSLGGLQVLDLTPEGHIHQRIVSVGKDPLVEDHTPRDILAELNADLYTMGQGNKSTLSAIDRRAFSFRVHRLLQSKEENDTAEIMIRMASVWYTHSPQFVMELQSCASEFKQYLTNLARSIKAAATDMAMGLVHARAEALAQTLYMNSRISSSLYGMNADVMSPRRRKRSYSQSSEPTEGYSGYASLRGTTPHTPYSPNEEDEFVIDIRLDVVLDSPVVVLPRNSNSTEVFVAHLGKITVNNNENHATESEHEERGPTPEPANLWDSLTSRFERYNIDVKDMNLYSLDTSSRRVSSQISTAQLGRAEDLYSCADAGYPILHDTMIRLTVDRKLRLQTNTAFDNFPNLILGEGDSDGPGNEEGHEPERCDNIQISGCVVTPLKLSMTRAQYEQLLDTFQTLVDSHTVPESRENSVAGFRTLPTLGEDDEDTGVTTLCMDPTMRARLFNPVGNYQQPTKEELPKLIMWKILFKLPKFTIELRGDMGSGEQALVDLSFCDFNVEYEKSHRYETNIQVSLRSLLMEDLSRPPESKHRCMVVSSAVNELPLGPCYLSRSCPDLVANPIIHSPSRGSLPDHLETSNIIGGVHTMDRLQLKALCPRTPPPSPNRRQKPHDNLVIISTLIVDPNAPNFQSHYNSLQRSTSVDFNCLDLVVSVESWVVVLDFFGLDSSGKNEATIRENFHLERKSETDHVVNNGNSELAVEVRSLTLVLTQPEREVAKANISNLSVNVLNRETKKDGVRSCTPSAQQRSISGRLGSMSLLDLTPHGNLYKDRFVSAGEQALNFNYIRFDEKDVLSSEFDAQLCLEMSSVLYVHTKRFVNELQSFFTHFSQLQSVMSSIRAATRGQVVQKSDKPFRLLLELDAGAPVILLPVSSLSNELLVADLGKLKVKNHFCFAGSENTISTVRNSTTKCLLNVMIIRLFNMDLYTARREIIERNSPGKIRRNMMSGEASTSTKSPVGLELGGYRVVKEGPSLLQEKCHLKLQVERNLDYQNCHDVADMSIHGNLSTLDGALNLSQYKLIRGFLAYNLGENTMELFSSEVNSGFLMDAAGQHPLSTMSDVWKVTSLRLDLSNVTVRLLQNEALGEPPLASINFIKSKLTIETFSDCTEDIDLVSQEIQLLDTRFNEQPANKRSNVFINILQPIHQHESDGVQAEIHSRKRKDHSKFTILLNNMRLMAILDWWELVRDFVFEPPQTPNDYVNVTNIPVKDEAVGSSTQVGKQEEIPFELKLNITDSEVVLVEDTSQWDTNAVILKSTTVISYRPSVLEKPLSCNLNHCEMFSCILGMEEETALSIIDPVTVNMEVNEKRILEVSLQHLSLRLSYHDMMMFTQMLNSIPKQTQKAKMNVQAPPANAKSQIDKLSALGFTTNDCVQALDNCDGQLDDAALWLTQNAVAAEGSSNLSKVVNSDPNSAHSSFRILAAELRIACLSLCIIDDCRDSDVPLVELTFQQLNIHQAIGEEEQVERKTQKAVVAVASAAPGYVHVRNDSEPRLRSGDGWLECIFAGDYYNRVLSGWEPFIEPWKCEIGWEFGLTANLQRNRLQFHVQSDDILNFNLTSTLIDLYSQVKDIWTQDYYNISTQSSSSSTAKDVPGSNQNEQKFVGSPPGYRRRSPFVPFALHNETGSRLSFTTLITTSDSIVDRDSPMVFQSDESWVEVAPGETVPFTFEGRGKLRHRDTHKLKIHQLAVKIDGWRSTSPISVDKVGVYFRHASKDIQKGKLSGDGQQERARVVFAVALEGTARKLVTIRSALILRNELPDMVEVKLENVGASTSKIMFMHSQQTMSIPLTHVCALMYVRPIDSKHAYMFCNQPLRWARIVRPGEVHHEPRECRSQRDHPYRLCISIQREQYPMDRGGSVSSNFNQPAHTLILRPPILVSNLLPQELHYATLRGLKGRISAGGNLSLHEHDMENILELSLHLDMFPGAGTLIVPPNCSSFTCRVRLEDHSRRRLFLNVSVTMLRGCGMEIVITAPFWIVNKTGVPLVFRQEGVATETAGQFEEHEIARMVAPLLFSLADPDASPTVVARVGNGVAPTGTPQWCHHFHLHPGMQTRKLRISMRDNRPDTIYVMGVDVRTGRGRYRDTNIVTVSPRYQLHNKSSYQLQFSQKCLATTLKDPGAQATYLRAVPNCHMAFHWPRLDRDQLLCVRIMDISDCQWSGGLRIDSNESLHVNIRDIMGRMYFLRLDVILQGATFFIVFTDADTMPPPIRVDNYSEVALTFAQTCCKDTYRCTARAHSSVPYALDEPTQPAFVTVTAPGGVSASYDMNRLGEGQQLTYENFIYIAFTGTFKQASQCDPLNVESQQLVLDIGSGGRIILATKQPGQRSQLWRMSSSGQLIHEGSSPPRPSQHPQFDKTCLVLDIEGPAPQPFSCTALVLRRPDPRRQSTQTWRFTDDGRLCCAHNNMCVQAKDGFFGLRSGSTAVLGLINSHGHYMLNGTVPIEQAVGRQRLRPGSGFLKLEITTDGPTRVIKIYDIKEKRIYAMPEERDWVSIAVAQRPNLIPDQNLCNDAREFYMKVQLVGGVGISVVSRRPPEELVYAHFKGIFLEATSTSTSKALNVQVGDIQCDNQLFEAANPTLIHVTKPSRNDEDKRKHMQPALHISLEMQTSSNEDAVIFKHLIVSLKPLAIYFEERLVLKLFAFAGFSKNEQELPDADETDFEAQRILKEVTATHTKRYYFGIIKLMPSQIRLSMFTASKLPPELQAIKRKLRLTLIKFEDATVDLEPFVKQHPFESSQFLIYSILKHFREELKWQAANILGSVDFLGNPLGFVNDVTEGVSGLIYDGSVGALVKNVTHGISNSAAKVTESISDGLGKVTMDDEHEEMRLRIRQVHSGSSRAHLLAGFKGLGFGILGGTTGIFKQIYEGASNEGIQGVFSGIGKGLVGAVTKPVVGVLDLASETARAVRDSSRSRPTPPRFRPPRCVVGSGGLMPLYSRTQALGQQYLHNLNNRDYSELLVAYEVLRGAPEDLRVIVSSEFVRIVTNAGGSSHLAVVIESHLSDLIQCTPVTTHESNNTIILHYIELTMRATSSGSSSGTPAMFNEPVRRPRIRCDSESLARWVSQQINYAKSMYEVRLHTLITDINAED